MIKGLNARVTIRILKKGMPVNLNAIIGAPEKVDVLRELRRLFTCGSREVDCVEGCGMEANRAMKHRLFEVRFAFEVRPAEVCFAVKIYTDKSCFGT